MGRVGGELAPGGVEGAADGGVDVGLHAERDGDGRVEPRVVVAGVVVERRVGALVVEDVLQLLRVRTHVPPQAHKQLRLRRLCVRVSCEVPHKCRCVWNEPKSRSTETTVAVVPTVAVNWAVWMAGRSGCVSLSVGSSGAGTTVGV